ncbi:MAG TPA: TrkA family potassium uptake protein [Clostridiales bacterium]|nr:TrkA family potassium uptake protein [Clostridiales bacterium]
MNVLIIGCSPVGAMLASVLSRLGHYVSIVDDNPSCFDNLSDDFSGITVTGIPLDTEVLEEAGINSSDAVVAATTDDNLNIVISQTATLLYKVPRVISVIADPSREDVFEHLGMATVCPTKITEGAVLNSILGQTHSQTVSFGTHTAIFTVRADKHWIGLKLHEIPVFEGEMVFGIVDSSGDLQLALDPDYILRENEKVVFTSIVD